MSYEDFLQKIHKNRCPQIVSYKNIAQDILKATGNLSKLGKMSEVTFQATYPEDMQPLLITRNLS